MENIKRFIALILSCSLLLTGCTQTSDVPQNTNARQETDSIAVVHEQPQEPILYEKESSLAVVDETTVDIPEFSSLSDAALLQYIEDEIYSDLEVQFNSEDYIIEDIQTIYISKEYLEELSYNSKSNIYFGYTLDEIEKQFGETSYIFTLGEDGTTIVKPFEDYDDTFDQVVRNVAIGTGVILVCVTVSVVSGGLGAPAVSVVFAASAKTGAAFALSSGVISGAVSAAVTGYQTKDYDAAMKAAALSGSESIKWGAISGAIIGGASEAVTLHHTAKTAKAGVEASETVSVASNSIPTPREAELLALEEYGGSEQVSFLAGKEVDYFTPGATRPDVVRTIDGHLEAIEVKNYNLESSKSLNTLYSELERQVTARMENLPSGSTQRIVLNVQGRGFTEELISTVTKNIQNRLVDIYPNIPIDIMGL